MHNTKRFFNVQRGKIVSGIVGGPVDPALRSESLRTRQAVDHFTESSRKRFKRYLINAVAHYRVFITLTYPPGYGTNGRTAKRDLDNFVKRYRRVRESKRFSVVWFMEFQKNGRIHFHLFGSQYWHHERVAKAWYEIVGSKQRKHLDAGTEIRKIRGSRAQITAYAAKYAVKNEQKSVPEGLVAVGRFWGVFGLRSLVEAAISIKVNNDAGRWRPAAAENEEILDFFNREVQKLKILGELSIKVIEGDGFRVVLWLWQVDQERIRLNLLDILFKLEKAND